MKWVDGGAPRGSAGDAPSPVQWPADGWQITPDLIVKGPEFRVPPYADRNVIEWTTMIIPSGFTKDTWVTSLEIKPSDLSVTHHICITFRPQTPDVKYYVMNWQEAARDADGVAIKSDGRVAPAGTLPIAGGQGASTGGGFSCYVPGVQADDYRPYGAAKLVPANSDISIQAHYTPTGKEVVDRPLIGFTGANQMTVGFSPTMDGTIVSQHPYHRSASPVSAEVPVMLGTTRTEMTLSSDAAALSLDETAMRKRIADLMGEHASPTIDVYRHANPRATPSDIYFLIASDYRYGAPAMKIAERRAALGKGPVYLYYFCWETPVEGGRLKSPHTMEIPFAFDNVKVSARFTGGGQDAMALADKISDAWIAFARSGDPNTKKFRFASSAWRCSAPELLIRCAGSS